METSIFVGRGANEALLLGKMANRHGLIAGATGTGKSVTLKVLAEGFSRMGVPVFMADVKGDLAGIAQPGTADQRIKDRVAKIDMQNWAPSAFPVTFWDVFGTQGHPIRTTVSDMGPLLLSRLLNLNEVQSGVLQIIFKVADEQGLLLLDLKDLQATLQYVADNSKDLTTEFGNVSSASVGAIQRGLLTLQEQGGDKFFGEPALNTDDLLQTDGKGMGVINILAADKLMLSPLVYSTLLLWLLSELYERLPEAGDLEKPKLVFFFDEAHLLFNDAPKYLIEKIEQVVRLIRSKAVGVYFISQSPLDIGETVLGQLGNRVQHALRAFSPKDQKSVKAAADTFRSDGKLDVAKIITELAIGEALVSMLDEGGSPQVVDRVLIAPPFSRMGAITPDERTALMKSSIVAGHYEQIIDRESAYEKLKGRAGASTPGSTDQGSVTSKASDFLGSVFGSSGRRQNPIQAFVVSTARSVGSQLGRQIFRGLLGSISGKSSK